MIRSQRLKNLLSSYFIEAALRQPSVSSLQRMRRFCGMQLFGDEILKISQAIKKHRKTQFLVFGLGNDSTYWNRLNRDGTTVFLEDNPQWFKFVTELNPQLNSHLISYTTKLKNWQQLLKNPQYLQLELPTDVDHQKWDVIFVDAPAGFDDESPGRMQSIYLASQLTKPGGDVFVHDCHREVERDYSTHFLGEDNLLATLGTLRHFKKAN